MKEIRFKQKAKKATPEESFWRDEQRKLIAGGPDLMDKTAQHILTAVSFLAAIYTAALSQLELIKIARLWFKVFSLIPLSAFIFAIILSFFALFPKTHAMSQDAPEEIEIFIKKLTRRKKRVLISSAIFIVFGLIVVITVFFIYFLFL